MNTYIFKDFLDNKDTRRTRGKLNTAICMDFERFNEVQNETLHKNDKFFKNASIWITTIRIRLDEKSLIA